MNMYNEEERYFSSKIEKELGSLYKSRVLVTGATGLIGCAIVKLLTSCGINVIAQGRSIDKLNKVFTDKPSNLEFLECDLENKNEMDNIICDYIIHCASPTSTYEYVNSPVHVLNFIYQSTLNLLTLAKKINSKGFVFVSSMEVYGEIYHENYLTEREYGYLEYLTPRSSYPVGKRSAESLCIAFCKQFQIPVKIGRLAMVYGPGVPLSDARVLNYFIKQIKNKETIILKTRGDSKASVIYSYEAAIVLIKILINGRSGEAYNVANSDNYYSILEMAKIAASIGDIKVKCEIDNEKQNFYRKSCCLNLSMEKMLSLGYKPEVSLIDIFRKSLD